MRPIFSSTLAYTLILALSSAQLAEAASQAVPAQGQGAMRNGIEACKAQLKRDALDKAMVKKITSLAGSYDASRHGDILARADEFVRRSKIGSVKKVGSEFCKATVKFRFNDGAITKALTDTSAGGARVGVVIRYSINGKLAEDAGVNPLNAVRAMNLGLQKYNCRLVDLLFAQDDFSRRMRALEIPLTGNDDEPEAVYQKGLSHAEAVSNALTGAGQELRRELSRGNAGFDRVVSGDISIRDMGKDPDGPNQLVNALISLSAHDIASKEILISTRPIPVPGFGPDKSTARAVALEASIETALGEIAEETEICGS